MSETTNPSIQTDFRIQELTAEISKLQTTIESQKIEIERLNQILGYEHHLFGKQYIETVTDSLGEHRVNRYDPSDAQGKWVKSELPAGQKFGSISPLFKKLDASIVEMERAKLG